MNSDSKQNLISLALLVFGFAAIFTLSNFLEQHRPTLPETYEDEDLSVQGANLKGYALGFEGLLADWYWIKSLQYLGGKFLESREDISLENLTPLNPRLLYPYLDNATTLDPKFTGVYEYGAVVLPAIDKEQAISLTQKGIANNPNNWRLYQYLGYIYWRLGDFEKAANVYEKGSLIDGAPDFMKFMAAKMKSDGGSRETAREIYKEISAKAEEEQTRNVANLRLMQIDSLDEREIIQKILNDFRSKNNRCANSWNEILLVLQKEKMSDGRKFSIDSKSNLIDPSGAPYLLDKQNCAVELDAEKTKIPLN